MTDRAASLLLVDDEQKILDAHLEILANEAYHLVTARSAEEAFQQLDEQFFDLLVLDDQLDERPGQPTGRDVLAKCREADPDVGAIFVSGHSDPQRIIDVLRIGASDYLVKNQRDFHHKMRQTVHRVLNQTEQKRQWRWFRTRLKNLAEPIDLIGQSKAMRRVKDQIKRIAPQDHVDVLITGETGTGKELVAAAIHQLSPRQDGIYLPCNIAGLEPSVMTAELFGAAKGAFTGANETRSGYFEAADGGTLFLDEIGELSVECQPKLLRVLECGQFQRVGETAEKRCNVRVVAATNRDLSRPDRNAGLREDLLQRFPVRIELPPLRDRDGDVELLTMHLINELTEKQGQQAPIVDDAAKSALLDYGWPGNVRELRNTLQRALILCEGKVLTRELLHFAQPPRQHELNLEQLSLLNYEAACRNFERSYWQGVLRINHENKSQAARHAGIDRSTVYDKLAACGLHETEHDTKKEGSP